MLSAAGCSPPLPSNQPSSHVSVARQPESQPAASGIGPRAHNTPTPARAPQQADLQPCMHASAHMEAHSCNHKRRGERRKLSEIVWPSQPNSRVAGRNTDCGLTYISATLRRVQGASAKSRPVPSSNQPERRGLPRRRPRVWRWSRRARCCWAALPAMNDPAPRWLASELHQNARYDEVCSGGRQ